VLRLALQTMRTRLHGFVGAFVALTLAVAIVSATGILVESGARAQVPVERYAGAPVVVAAEQSVAVDVGGEVVSQLVPEHARLPAGLAGRIAPVDGVRTVILDRSIPATVATAKGRVLYAPDDEAVLAHGWSSAQLTPYTLTTGRPPGAGREVVLDATFAGQGGITVGDDVRITSTDGTETYAVVGLARAPLGSDGRQGTAFVSNALAASLSVDAARVDALGVLLDEDADPDLVAERIERTLGGRVAVHTGEDRGKAESPEAVQANEELVSLAGVFGSFAVILAIFVVAATLGLSVLQRGRELALLRTVGAKPRQIRRLLVGETLIVALVAGVAGVVPGVLLASFLLETLRQRGIGAESATLVVGPLPPAIAVAIGMVTAGLAAWLAGRRAARIRPTAALAEAALEPKRVGWLRLLLGLAFLAGGLFLSATALSLQGEAAAFASFGVVMILMVAVGLLGPLLARITAAIFGPGIAALFRTSGFLAMANIRARARRFASASTPIALGVAISLVLIGTVTVQASATENQSRDRMLADRVLTAPGIPAGLVDEVRGLPGVAAATGLLPTEVSAILHEFDGRRFEYLPAVGVSPHGIDETLDLDVREGSVATLPRDGVAVSVDRARSLDAGVGDSVSLWLGDGQQVRLRVVALYASSLGLGEYVLPRALVAGHVSYPMDAQMLVKYADGADSAALDARLASLAGATPGVNVLDRGGFQAAEDEEAERSAWVTYLMIGVLMAFIAIAAVNSLVMAVGERSRELAQLRLVGATPRQVTRMVRWEALAVIGFGVLIGVAVAAATLVPFSLALAHTAVPYLPWQVVVGVVAGALLLGLSASELPTRNALRRDPVEVIGTQE
jgi:putative ABC transport system permease protein